MDSLSLVRHARKRLTLDLARLAFYVEPHGPEVWSTGPFGKPRGWGACRVVLASSGLQHVCLRWRVCGACVARGVC